MNIAGTEVNLKHKALEIYIAGCNGYCKGCQNPELWDFTIPSIAPCHIYKELADLQEAKLINSVWILGGEPLDSRPIDLAILINNLEIPTKVLWTHFELSQVPKEILNLVTHIKTGPYIPNKESYVEPVFGVTLANPEQKIWEL